MNWERALPISRAARSAPFLWPRTREAVPVPQQKVGEQRAGVGSAAEGGRAESRGGVGRHGLFGAWGTERSRVAARIPQPNPEVPLSLRIRYDSERSRGCKAGFPGGFAAARSAPWSARRPS